MENRSKIEPTPQDANEHEIQLDDNSSDRNDKIQSSNEIQVEQSSLRTGKDILPLTAYEEGHSVEIVEKTDTDIQIIKDTSDLPLLQRIKRGFQKILSKLHPKNDMVILGILIVSIVFYIIGLLPCYDIRGCFWGLGLRVFIVVAILTFISCLIVTLFVFFIILTRQHFIHLAYVVPIYLFFFIYFKGTNNINHGEYNSMAFILYFIVLSFIFTVVCGVYYSIKYKKYYIPVIFVVVYCFLLWLFRYSNLYLNFSCENWDKGLNNTFSDNTSKDFGCAMVKPGKNNCYLNALDNLFDFSAVMGYDDCNANKIRDDEYGIFIEYLPSKLKNRTRFGYPITTSPKYPYTVGERPEGFQHVIYENIIDMDEYEKETNTSVTRDPKPEVQVEFNKSKKGKISIHVNTNETLSKERKRIEESITDDELIGPYKNVLLIYLDGVSRPNFFRKLKQTAEYLEQFTRYDPNIEQIKNSLFQFMKYNTLDSKTIPNIKAMFYGIPYSGTNGTNIVRYFKEKGFVTGHTGTTCGREIFQVKLFKFGDKVRYLEYDSWDHEGISVFCDLNFVNYRYPLERGVNSYFRRCMYGQPVHDYAFDYVTSFWEAYPDNKKFFRVHLNEGHDPSNSLLTYFDEALLQFIRSFYEKGYFDDTFVMIMSDHGLHLPGPWRFISSQDYNIEQTIGTFMIIVPNEKRLHESGLFQTLRDNQQVFVTPYDIHDTLIYLAAGKDQNYQNAYSKHGMSIFEPLDHAQRFCESSLLNLQEFNPGSCKCKRNK